MGFFKKIVDLTKEASTFEILTFDDCLRYFAKCRKLYPQICAFVLSIEKNRNSKNNNDDLIVIQGLLDEDHKAITLDGVTGLSRVLYTKTIDKKLIDFLSGETIKIYVSKEK